MESDWIPVQWEHKADLANFHSGITIHRTVSPFYPDVRYGVRSGRYCLTVDGIWEYEPQPSSRDAAFYNRCRFVTFEDAISTAEKCKGVY